MWIIYSFGLLDYFLSRQDYVFFFGTKAKNTKEEKGKKKKQLKAKSTGN